MSKRILVISTSLRKNSNSEALADEFIKGAKEAGHEVEKVSLADMQIVSLNMSMWTITFVLHMKRRVN